MGVIDGGGGSNGPEWGYEEGERMSILGITPADPEQDFGDPPEVRLDRLDTEIGLLRNQREELARQIENNTAETTDKC